MKRLLIPFIFLLTLTACTDDLYVVSSHEIQSSEGLTAIEIAYLENANLSSLKRIVTNNAIILDGDMVILRSEIISPSNVDNKPQTHDEEKHYTSLESNLPTGPATNVSYFIDNSVATLPFGNDWINAILTAEDELQNISNCHIDFDRVFNSAQATINIIAAPLGSSVYADARIPVNGNVGNLIRINDGTVNGRPISNPGGKISVMLHEFMHTLGIQHTDGVNPGITTEFWACTDDANSVFNSTIDANMSGRLSLTSGDRKLASLLFPRNPETPNFSLQPILVDEFIDGTRVYDLDLQISPNGNASGGQTTIYTIEETEVNTYNGQTYGPFVSTFTHQVSNSNMCISSGATLRVGSNISTGGPYDGETCFSYRIRANYVSRDGISPWTNIDTYCFN